MLLLPLVAGCTPYIPEKLDFAQQICATPYQPGDVSTSDASPGQLVTAHGTCAQHLPIIGN
jgi:hypothetical protein